MSTDALANDRIKLIAMTPKDIHVSPELIDAINTFPVRREVRHCDTTFSANPFEISVRCPRCGVELKLRSFAAVAELEDVFDAVFEWMNKPGAAEMVKQRRQSIK